MRASTILRAAVVALALLGGACGGDDDGGGGDDDGAPMIDAAPPDAAEADAFDSICGQPGDVGNEVGVGKFCNTIGDCSSTPQAHLCATLGDPKAHFCTRICSNEDAGVDVCGTGATCTCGGGGTCGCTPNACL
jgi:hypothetical protein